MKTELWGEVVDLLGEQVNQDAILAILSILLTAEERDAIGSRLAIMRALLSGRESQRQIAIRLEVSIAKVTRCSNYLKTLNGTDAKLIEG